MLRNREARLGFTLTEVLMAMFVMAIGMISLLALFPVAFQQAKWALDNEQIARGAANAQAMTEMPRVTVDAAGMVGMKSQSIRNDEKYRPDMNNPSLCWKCAAPMTTQLGRPMFLVDTVSNSWTFNPDISVALPGTKVVFPPVFVDPFIADTFVDTAAMNGTNIPFHVGMDNLTFAPFSTVTGSLGTVDAATLRPRRSVGIPRSSMSQYVMDPDPFGMRKQLENSMGDEIDFGTNGQPVLNAASQFARQRRFTWAYMCQWPNYTVLEACDVTAVIFNSRPTNGGLATLPPGEVTYSGNAIAAGTGPGASGTDPLGWGRIFVKGLTQATIFLGPKAQPMTLKPGDWILDSTMILPEYNPTFPNEKVPFLDTYNPAYEYTVSATPLRKLRPGLVGGHFYKVLDVSTVKAGGPGYYQTITIDRPAKSDGFSATTMMGIADVITKGVGRMPQH